MTRKPPAFANIHTKYVKAPIDLPPAIDLQAMLDAGIPAEQIADDHGCAVSTIRRRISDSGIHQSPTVDDDPAPVLAWRPPDWTDRALCAQTDPEAFFPKKGGSTREAKKVCAGCEVAAECLDTALAHNERFGIFGGLSELERHHLAQTMKETQP